MLPADRLVPNPLFDGGVHVRVPIARNGGRYRPAADAQKAESAPSLPDPLCRMNWTQNFDRSRHLDMDDTRIAAALMLFALASALLLSG
jgi:hypothetical protein